MLTGNTAERAAEDKLASAASALKSYCYLLRHALAAGEDVPPQIAAGLEDLERPHLSALDEVGDDLSRMVEEARRVPDVSPHAARVRLDVIKEKAKAGESATTISEVVQLPSNHVQNIMEKLLKAEDPAYSARVVSGRVING